MHALGLNPVLTASFPCIPTFSLPWRFEPFKWLSYTLFSGALLGLALFLRYLRPRVVLSDRASVKNSAIPINRIGCAPQSNIPLHTTTKTTVCTTPTWDHPAGHLRPTGPCISPGPTSTLRPLHQRPLIPSGGPGDRRRSCSLVTPQHHLRARKMKALPLLRRQENRLRVSTTTRRTQSMMSQNGGEFVSSAAWLTMSNGELLTIGVIGLMLGTTALSLLLSICILRSMSAPLSTMDMNCLELVGSMCFILTWVAAFYRLWLSRLICLRKLIKVTASMRYF